MKILSTETREISPAEAGELAKLFYSGIQRSIRPAAVSIYLDEMRSGRWGVSDSMVVVGVCGERQILIGGNHRMVALALHNAPVTMTIQHRQYDSDEEMRQDYIRTNSGMTAKISDKLRAYETDKAMEIPLSWAKTSVAGLKLVASGFTRSASARYSDMFFINALPQWENSIRAYTASTHGCYSKEVQIAHRAPVVAIGLLTFRFAPQKAVGFWKRVWDNDGLRKGEPEWALRTWVMNNTTRAYAPEDYAGAVAYAWNAHYEGREMQFTKALQGGSVVIKGTPVTPTFKEWRALVEGAKG